MIKRLKILVILILIAQSVYSQAGLDSSNQEYPKLLVDKEDTFLILTVEQVKKLNILYVEKNKFEILTDSLLKQNSDYELVIVRDKELINNLKEQLILKDNISTEKDGIIKELNDKNKKLSRKLKMNMFFNKGLIIVSIILGVLIIK